jgi:hypothetical protein
LPGLTSVDLRVSVTAADGEAATLSEVVLGARPLETVEITIDSPESRVRYDVGGTVANTGRAAVAGLDVRIVDRNVGDDLWSFDGPRRTSEAGITSRSTPRFFAAAARTGPTFRPASSSARSWWASPG